LNGKVMAVKIIPKHIGKASDMEQLEREVWIMKRLSHPNIVQLFEVFETGDKYYLVME
jgi:serine/threonine protein kinase